MGSAEQLPGGSGAEQTLTMKTTRTEEEACHVGLLDVSLLGWGSFWSDTKKKGEGGLLRVAKGSRGLGWLASFLLFSQASLSERTHQKTIAGAV